MLRNAKRRSAFTVIELVAVASIMAILSLILVQQLRVRVDDSRKSAAMADLKTLSNILTVSYGETTAYFPLQCYGQSETPYTRLQWNAASGLWELYDLTAQERTTLATKWQGSYSSFEANSLMMDTMFTRLSGLFTVTGPLYRAVNDRYYHYPLDPWGNPYVVVLKEGANKGGYVYSLGPDGKPGVNGDSNNPSHYIPWEPSTNNGYLGQDGSDDLEREF